MKKNRCGVYVVVLALMMALLPARVIYATGTGAPEIVQACTTDDTVSLFVRGIGGTQDAEYLIGNVQTDAPTAVTAVEAGYPMRTLIMLDNSMSTAPYGDAIKALIQSVVENHADREQFRLATFGADITYLTDYSEDYLALYNTAAGIQFETRDTFLTDVLIPLLTEMAEDEYAGYSRIVLITDGVDNKELGMTRGELDAVLKRRNVPLYTVGVRGNDADLQAFFSLARQTHGAEVLLEDAQSAISALVTALAADRDMVVYSVTIPESTKDGSTRNTQLTLADGTKLSTEITLPFSAQQPAPEEPEPTEEKPKKEKVREPEPEPEEEGLPIWIFLAAGAAALVVLIGIIIAVAAGKKKSDKKRGTPEMPDAGDRTVSVADNEKTEIIGYDFGNEDGHTEQLFTPVGMMRVKLEDVDRPDISFLETVSSSPLTIGRSSERANVVINYDKTVGRTQCRLSVQNGQLILENLSESNITKLDDRNVGGPEPVFSGSIITMGRVRVRVTILDR